LAAPPAKPPSITRRGRSRINVHLVFTTSSKTVGARNMRPAPITPRQLTVLLEERVEVEQVLVETEHVGDRRCQRVARTLADAAGEGIDAELAAPLR
jgi:hypothetical protein